MTDRLSLLAPSPQKVQETGSQLTLGNTAKIALGDSSGSSLFTAIRLQDALLNGDVEASITAAADDDADIALEINPMLVAKSQGYRLLVEDHGVTIVGADPTGLFYGVCTLIQLIDLFGGGAITLPTALIEDWPDFAHRGIMLDISRDRVPTMETLYGLVELMASLKLNELQLYTEHTFAYAGHDIVWENASPMTAEEILLLDAFCRERYVELVPNQNSFGHMHRWLKYDEYRHLAEAPEGVIHPFTPIPEPYSFCPIDPGSLALLEDMYAQLLPNFTSTQFNVGLDETFDLGMGRSKEICEEKGTGIVYLDFLKQIHGLAKRHGRTMQFWSDIIVRDEPELVNELPRDVIAMEWGYEDDYPFAENTELIAKSGRTFYVCPGTSSWNTYTGRTDNALGNLQSAAIHGFNNGAIGYLNTDWGDNGHMQPLPVSYLGYLAGAAMSWNAATAQDKDEPDWPGMLDAHVFHDSAGVMGQLVYDMGLLYTQTGGRIHNSNPLFWMSILPDALPEGRYPDDLSTEKLEATLSFIDNGMASLGNAAMNMPDAELVLAEYKWLADVSRWACRLGIARLAVGLDEPVEQIDARTRAELADELEPLIERYRELWLQRSREGGLDDSCSRLGGMLIRLQAE